MPGSVGGPSVPVPVADSGSDSRDGAPRTGPEASGDAVARVYRLALLLSCSHGEAVRLTVEALEGAPTAGGARQPGHHAGAPTWPDAAAAVAEHWVRTRRWPWSRPRPRWTPWRELQGEGPPGAWELALAVSRLPDRLRAAVALTAYASLTDHGSAQALGIDATLFAAWLEAAARRTGELWPGGPAGEMRARWAPALRHVMDHEPVPPAVSGAAPAGRPEPRTGWDPPGMSAEESWEVAAQAPVPRRRGVSGRTVLLGLLIAVGLGLALLPVALGDYSGRIPTGIEVSPADLPRPPRDWDPGPFFFRGVLPVAEIDPPLDGARAPFALTGPAVAEAVFGQPCPSDGAVRDAVRRLLRVAERQALLTAEERGWALRELGLVLPSGRLGEWRVIRNEVRWQMGGDWTPDCRPRITVHSGRRLEALTVLRQGALELQVVQGIGRAVSHPQFPESVGWVEVLGYRGAGGPRVTVGGQTATSWLNGDWFGYRVETADRWLSFGTAGPSPDAWDRLRQEVARQEGHYLPFLERALELPVPASGATDIILPVPARDSPAGAVIHPRRHGPALRVAQHPHQPPGAVQDGEQRGNVLVLAPPEFASGPLALAGRVAAAVERYHRTAQAMALPGELGDAHRRQVLEERRRPPTWCSSPRSGWGTVPLRPSNVLPCGQTA